MLALSSLGVYMGRFLRWNSWDVLRHPFLLFKYGRFDHQDFVQPVMRIFLGLMFLFLVLSYAYVLRPLAQFHVSSGSAKATGPVDPHAFEPRFG